MVCYVSKAYPFKATEFEMKVSACIISRIIQLQLAARFMALMLTGYKQEHSQNF